MDIESAAKALNFPRRNAPYEIMLFKTRLPYLQGFASQCLGIWRSTAEGLERLYGSYTYSSCGFLANFSEAKTNGLGFGVILG